jgi:hypothetical protein
LAGIGQETPQDESRREAVIERVRLRFRLRLEE